MQKALFGEKNKKAVQIPETYEHLNPYHDTRFFKGRTIYTFISWTHMSYRNRLSKPRPQSGHHERPVLRAPVARSLFLLAGLVVLLVALLTGKRLQNPQLLGSTGTFLSHAKLGSPGWKPMPKTKNVIQSLGRFSFPRREWRLYKPIDLLPASPSVEIQRFSWVCPPEDPRNKQNP